MPSKPLVFPQDHNSHETVIEWWYFNGSLRDAAGNAYSFMDCLFKADIDKVAIPYLKHISRKKPGSKSRYVYFAHSIVSDIGKQKNHKEVQNISLVSNDSFNQKRLFIDYIDPVIVHGFVNNEIAEVAPDTFHIKTNNLDLVLKSKKSPLLEGGEGYITVCGRDSYYYSLTDMEASGTLSIEGKKIEVKGAAWMDHQWADVSYRQDKWTWFSMQLDDGTDMMCCEYDDGKSKDFLIDIIEKNGAQHHLNKLILRPADEKWKSPLTKAEYPLAWDIEIPDYDAKLHIKSLMTDQEMIFMAINYWEGPIKISGTIGGKNVKGNGFMELVGYPTDYNYLLSVGKEIGKKIADMLNEKMHKKASIPVL